MYTFRIATYNVHRCQGLDRRVSPARIVKVLNEINADVIALQEVVSVPDSARHHHQARFIAEELGMNYFVGENRRHWGGGYGNVLLTRFPVHHVRNYDLSVDGRERRGCLRTDIELQGRVLLHVFNVHLGTAFLERRHQARKLIDHRILANPELRGSRVMLGDFNEWTRGLTTRLLRTHLRSPDVKHHLRRTRTYPGILPLMHLDHVYHDEELKLEGFSLHRSRAALVASDHLPLVAEFRI